MRCGCPNCQAFMIHAEDEEVCVCPDCGYRCNACLGTATVVEREQLAAPLDDPRILALYERILHPETAQDPNDEP